MMKRKLLLIALTTCLAFVSSCKYDDSDLKSQLKDHETRIAAIEAALATANGQISGIQTALTALQNGIQITSVTPLPDGDGYTINFSKGNPITIKNGAKGSDGKDGTTPIIGVDLYDGVYYWTVTKGGTTEWITDAEGNKIPTTGLTPVLGIDESGYWTIKWGSAPVDFLYDVNGDKIIAKVSNLPFNLEINLEGTELVFDFFELEKVIRMAVAQPFGISVAEATEDYILYIDGTKTYEFTVEITGITEADYVSLRADIQGKKGNASDVNTTRSFTGIESWEVDILGKPIFTDGKATVKVKITAPTLTSAGDYMTNMPNANLTLTVLGKDGRTSAATYLLKIGQNQSFHIFPDDANLRDGIYTVPAIAQTAERITLVFEGNHQSKITVVVPAGFELPIDMDFDLTTASVSLKIENPVYQGTISLVDYYGSGNSIELNNLDIDLPMGSFVVGGNYRINGTANVITASSTFKLSKDASIKGDLNVNGGRAEIYGKIIGKTYISGVGTEVYFDNNKLNGLLFRTSDIVKMNNSDFVGFNALELLKSVDLNQLVDILNAVNSSGLIDMTGIDLGSISGILANGPIDLTFLQSFFSTNFYYAGAISRFDNPYFVSNHGTLTKVEYTLNSNSGKYVATLDRDIVNTPVMDAIDKYMPMINNSLEIARKYHPEIPNVDLRNIIPTYYAATDNFSMQSVVDVLNLLDGITGFLDMIDDNGNIVIKVYGFPVTLPLAEIVKIYSGGTLTPQQITYKKILDPMFEGIGVNMNEIGPMLGVIIDNMTTIKSVVGYIDAIKGPVNQANDFINSLKAQNPWVYSAGGAKFTKATVINSFSAKFSLESAGQQIIIDAVK